jgi:hypothetical protein
LFGENGRIKTVMQRKRAAADEPRRHAERDASKRAGRDRRQDICVLFGASLQKHRQPAGDQLAMAARDRHEAVAGNIEGDGSDMGVGVARPGGWLEIDRRTGSEHIVERRHPHRADRARSRRCAGSEIARPPPTWRFRQGTSLARPRRCLRM